MSNQNAVLHKKWASGILYRGLILLIITPILKSLVVPVIWLALIGAIYSRIAPFFALNCILSPANEEATLETKQPIRFQFCRKMWDKEYHVANFATFVPKTYFFLPKKEEFNFKPAQYCIYKIFELTKSCIWAISKWV